MILLVCALLALGLTACFGSKEEPKASESASYPASTPQPSNAPSNEPSQAPTESGGDMENRPRGGVVLISPFGETTFEGPVGIATRKDDPRALYIVEQPGRIVRADLDRPADKPVTILDITDRVYNKGDEQGLLGLAFHPDDPGRAFVNYTTKTETVIARFDASAGEPTKLDPSSEEKLLTFKQPFANHNGGQLAFGPDGYLYIGTGDGGSGGDPYNNSQNLDSLLGKILRIDVDRPAQGAAYGIPADNPFLNDGRPEIYAYGLRNPWRFSFDEETGQLWAADVGQSTLEEIDLVKKGGNYGWRIQEGTLCYDPKENCETEGLEPPIYVYGRDQGVSITGGYVYRGSERTDLRGWYVFGDYGMGTIWALRQRENGAPDVVELLASEENITSFGADASGELYLCTQEGRILRLT